MNRKLLSALVILLFFRVFSSLYAHQWPWSESSLVSRFGIYHSDVFNKGLLFDKNGGETHRSESGESIFTDGTGLFPASVSGYQVYSEEDSYYTFYQKRPEHNFYMIYDRLGHCFLNPLFYISEMTSSGAGPMAGQFFLESPAGVFPLDDLPENFSSGTFRLLLSKDELDFYRIVIFLNGEDVLQLSFEAVEEINGSLYLKGEPAVSVSELSKGVYYNLGLIHLNPGMNDLEIIRQDFSGNSRATSEMINLKKNAE